MNFFSTINLENESSLLIEDEQVHHFKNVQRGKIGAEVKVFDGLGSVAIAQVKEIKKKSLLLDVESYKKVEKKTENLKLILGTPKKEYVESILRTVTQIGIDHILMVETKFSPFKFSMNDRFLKILKSAVIQSENPWMPTIEHLKNLENLSDIKEPILVFSTEKEASKVEELDKGPAYYFIGPEGGFHQDELDYLSGLQNVSFLKCETPIMKAEVAVSYCAAIARGAVASLQTS